MKKLENFTTTREFKDSLRNIPPLAVTLSDTNAKDVYERMLKHESRLITNNCHVPLMGDYDLGTAEYPNEIIVLRGANDKPLLSAEHAVDVTRKTTPRLGGADHGTAALAAIMHEDNNLTSVIPIGHNVAASIDHPIKDTIRREIDGKVGFVSLHSMAPGKILDYADDNEIHAILGLSTNFTEQTS